MGVSIIGMSDASKSFLPCSIPYLKLDFCIVYHDNFVLEKKKKNSNYWRTLYFIKPKNGIIFLLLFFTWNTFSLISYSLFYFINKKFFLQIFTRGDIKNGVNLTLKSIPTVEIKLPERNWPSLNRTRRQVLPTPESPSSITYNHHFNFLHKYPQINVYTN